jgi:hypothetical protein
MGRFCCIDISSRVKVSSGRLRGSLAVTLFSLFLVMVGSQFSAEQKQQRRPTSQRWVTLIECLHLRMTSRIFNGTMDRCQDLGSGASPEIENLLWTSFTWNRLSPLGALDHEFSSRSHSREVWRVWQVCWEAWSEIPWGPHPLQSDCLPNEVFEIGLFWVVNNWIEEQRTLLIVFEVPKWTSYDDSWRSWWVM